MDLSPFYHREKLRNVLFCCASSSSFVAPESRRGPFFVGLARSQFVSYMKASTWVRWGGVVNGSSPLLLHRQRYPE